MGAIAASVRGQSKSSEPWRRPSVTVARLSLESYVRRGLILFDVVAVVVVLVALCYPFQSATASFYGGVGLALGAVAVLGTVILARPAASARTYLVLARLPARGAYSRGLLLAAATLRVFDSLLAVALAVGTQSLINFAILDASIYLSWSREKAGGTSICPFPNGGASFQDEPCGCCRKW